MITSKLKFAFPLHQTRHGLSQERIREGPGQGQDGGGWGQGSGTILSYITLHTKIFIESENISLSWSKIPRICVIVPAAAADVHWLTAFKTNVFPSGTRHGEISTTSKMLLRVKHEQDHKLHTIIVRHRSFS